MPMYPNNLGLQRWDTL